MRLDVYLVEIGCFASRSKARSAIESGKVLVDGKVAEKVSQNVNGDEKIEISEKEKYVSRAGVKLEHALSEFGVSPKGLICLDIGASTGGFTDCLLQNGAKKVYSLDVGTAQLAESLRNDTRVTVMENRNARYIKKSDFGEGIDLIVMDVSFISQTLIYEACADILDIGKRMITLIKPQFEAGKENIGKGGIVRDTDGKIIKEILNKLGTSARENGFEMLKFTDSPIEGGDGNREYLALFERKE